MTQTDPSATEAEIDPSAPALAPEAEPAAPQGAAAAAAAPTREVEVKFITDAAGLAAALASPLLGAGAPATPARKLISVYFDTPDMDLQQRRISLRVRRDGRKSPLMALKWTPEAAEGAFSRGEIEIPVAKLQPDLSLFTDSMGDLVRRIVGDKPLVAQHETRVTRRIRDVARGATKIEIAFDEGVILAGDKTAPLCEVELELKSGEARDLYDYAALAAEVLPLRLDIVSKAERAYRLASGVAASPVKIKPVALPPQMILDEAIARIILSSCEHYVANWAPLRDSEDPESIHQMRVALRRMRAALAMFKRVIPCPEFDLFRAEAGALASALGAARDSDALRELIEDGPMAHFGEKRDFSPLLDALEQRRLAAYVDARALMESQRPSLFVLRVSAFVERRGWRNSVAGDQLTRLTEPVVIFAAEALERLHKRVLKRGKRLTTLPDELRHEARIALKNLRYGAEFFSPSFDDARAASDFVRAAAVLQNLLGAHNDAASAEHFLSDSHEYEAARAAGVITGWYARDAIFADEKLAQAWKTFKRSRQFWR